MLSAAWDDRRPGTIRRSWPSDGTHNPIPGEEVTNMELDVNALQILPEEQGEVQLWPCAPSAWTCRPHTTHNG